MGSRCSRRARRRAWRPGGARSGGCLSGAPMACVRRQRGLLLQRERPDQLHASARRRAGGDGQERGRPPEVRGRLTRGLARFLRGSELAEKRNTGGLWSAVTSDERTCPAAVRKGVWFLAVTPVPLSASSRRALSSPRRGSGGHDSATAPPPPHRGGGAERRLPGCGRPRCRDRCAQGAGGGPCCPAASDARRSAAQHAGTARPVLTPSRPLTHGPD